MTAGSPPPALWQLVVFTLQGQRFGLPLSQVVRIVRAVEVTPVPRSPDMLHGVIDLAGQVIPVLNLRERLGLPRREIGPDDQFMIVHNGRRTLALAVDATTEMIELPGPALVPSEAIFPGLERIGGVARREDGLMLIHDLDKFLTPGEERMLDAATKELKHEG